MYNLQQTIVKQDDSLKTEMDRLIKLTEESEKERKKAVDEIKRLKDEFKRQRKEQSDIEWENVSRTLHWKNNMEELNFLTPEKSGLKLKTAVSEVEYDLMQLLKSNEKGNRGPVSGQLSREASRMPKTPFQPKMAKAEPASGQQKIPVKSSRITSGVSNPSSHVYRDIDQRTDYRLDQLNSIGHVDSNLNKLQSYIQDQKRNLKQLDQPLYELLKAEKSLHGNLLLAPEINELWPRNVLTNEEELERL